jgi:U3 small nucleolar ribonucleoprotein protein LCP5
MASSDDGATEGDSQKDFLAIAETAKKVESTLLPALKSHVTTEEFSASKDGLDFLDVKNSLLLSYMIDLTVYVRNKSNGKVDPKNLNRLTEMKTVMDKLKNMDKKLRYQIDKLLNANTSATTFAAGGDMGPEDPLQFRPDPTALEENSDEDSDDGDDDDADLAAAKKTLSLSKEKKSRHNDEDEEDTVYRAPRLTAVPYAFDQENKSKEKEKRARRRMRATELAQTLREQYGDAPEQEDMHGGSALGKQRVAAQRVAEREAEKTRFEEENMIRLTTSRKDRKEKNSLMRKESSNLSAIADLGNLVRETKEIGRQDDNSEDDEAMPDLSFGKQRYDNGKRRRDLEGVDGKQFHNRNKSKVGKAKNGLQAALYSSEGKRKKKKGMR